MKKLQRRMRTAVVLAASVALVIQPAFAGSSSKKSSSRTLCSYCAWLPGIDCYGEYSEYECDGAKAKGDLKLNTKKCTLELCFSGKVYNYSGCEYCEYVDPYDFVTEVIDSGCCYEEYYYDCWEALDLLDCCVYKVSAPKKSHSKKISPVGASLKCTGYLSYDYDAA